MDITQVNAAVEELARPYADKRVNIFSIEPPVVEGNTLHLKGRVLEESQRKELIEGLSSRFPGVNLDASAVTVIRKSPADARWVATNLTSMHDGTSFIAEQVTQMLNGMQVEILWTDKNWGYARQVDGYLGWTYLPYLTSTAAGSPTHLVIEPVGLLHEQPAADGALVTRVLGGTQVCVAEQRGDWAFLELAGGIKGWLPTADLRPLDRLPQTAAERRAQLELDALRMIGVPYLWGGNSANGIDCSGLAQLLHRWLGITLPRDADMQFNAGQEVEPPLSLGDLLFFGEKGEKRRITHVGISLGGWRMIHSSRARNGVQVDDVQAVPHLRDSFLCAATYIGR